ncbi:MAG: hypothetical protein ACT4TC_06095 [Myxococcaceae bacterium]
MNELVSSSAASAAGSARLCLVTLGTVATSPVTRILRSTGASFEVRNSLAEALAHPPSDLLVLEFDRLDDSDLRNLERAQAHNELPCRLLFLARDMDSQRLAELMQCQLLTNLIAGEAQSSGEDLRITVQKILSNDVFGIDKYFGWGVEQRKFKLRRSTDRQEVMEQAQKLANVVGAHARLAIMYEAVVDEFVTNAVYNAPVDEQGVRRFTDRPRDQEVLLGGEEEVEIVLASDGRRLAVSARDPFGSLKLGHMLESLGKNLGKRFREVQTTHGGAGLGLPLIFDSLSQFVVNLQPGVRTEMIGIIHADGTYRDFLQQKKSFNLFVSRAK